MYFVFFRSKFSMLSLLVHRARKVKTIAIVMFLCFIVPVYLLVCLAGWKVGWLVG